VVSKTYPGDPLPLTAQAEALPALGGCINTATAFFRDVRIGGSVGLPDAGGILHADVQQFFRVTGGSGPVSVTIPFAINGWTDGNGDIEATCEAWVDNLVTTDPFMMRWGSIHEIYEMTCTLQYGQVYEFGIGADAHINSLYDPSHAAFELSATVAPEPSGVLLLATGLVGWGAMAWRRRGWPGNMGNRCGSWCREVTRST